MSGGTWLGKMKLRDCAIEVRKRNGALVLSVESPLKVSLAPKPTVAVGDMIKILYEEPNAIVADSDDSDSDPAVSEGYGLVTSVDDDTETVSGLWVYGKDHLPRAARSVIGSSAAVLTTAPFEAPVDFDSIIAIEAPPNLHPRVLHYESKELADMTTAVLSGILTTAGHRGVGGRKRRRLGSVFDLPGHASHYKPQYDAADPATQAAMDSVAKLLYTLPPPNTDWGERINELKDYVQFLDAAAARSV
jgi:hypothetical protein